MIYLQCTVQEQEDGERHTHWRKLVGIYHSWDPASLSVSGLPSPKGDLYLCWANWLNGQVGRLLYPTRTTFLGDGETRMG